MPKYSDAAILDAYAQAGTKAGAARLLGMDERGYKRRYKALKQANEFNVPDGFSVTRISELQRDDGGDSIRWVRKDKDKEQQAEALKAAMAAFKAELPKAEPVQVTDAPRRDDLLNLYPIADYHLGMQSWGEETGADWDTSIAEELIKKWFDAAIGQAPNAETAVLALLGDFLHWDGMEAVTPASGHLLDADTRFSKVVRVAIQVIRHIVRVLLTKHGKVHLIACEGNHDPASSIWIRELFDMFYSDEPRVTVDTNPDPYYAYEFGANALFFHHGHKRKIGSVDTVFAAKFREMFGRTTRAYAHLGHLHSVDIKETNLMIVEQHRTLAGSDAYASRGGWISGRDAKVITYHAQHGDIGRVTISPAMVT